MRKNADTNSTKEKRFLDTHLMKNQLLSDDKHQMKNYQIVLKNSIIDGVDKVKYFQNTEKGCCYVLFFYKKALDY